MSDQNSERRSFSRITFDGAVMLSQGNKHWGATLLDLSLKGLLIEQPSDWDGDTTAGFEAHIPLNPDTPINMSVQWRHSHNGQIGFECEHIDIESISHLRRLVELNLGDETLLERELAALGK